MSQGAVESMSLDKTKTGATGTIGHYTQVVWAKTSEVGCGFKRATHPQWGFEDVSMQRL